MPKGAEPLRPLPFPAVKKTIAVIAILLVALIISLWHRMPGEDTRSTKVFLMDTFVELLAEGSRNQAEKAFKEAIRELKRLDTRLGYENSLIDELNRSRTLKDREVYCLVRISKEIHASSSGGFSITLRPILDAWGFTGLHPHRLPTESEFAAWKSLPSDEAVSLSPDGVTIEIPKGLQIDLGGIAKGYAADRAAEAMKKSGIESGLVNAGGDITAFGERTWKVGIKHPRGPGVFTTIPVRNRSVATSGDYERFFVQNGIRYSHILDPATGRPARVLSSATIIADTGTDTDAWATALFVKGPQTLKDELEKRGMDWIAVDLEGNITTSGPMREFCPEKLPEPRKN